MGPGGIAHSLDVVASVDEANRPLARYGWHASHALFETAVGNQIVVMPAGGHTGNHQDDAGNEDREGVNPKAEWRREEGWRIHVAAFI